jgi:hypothetical protein
VKPASGFIALLFFSAVAAAQTLPDDLSAGVRLAETEARNNLTGLLTDKQIAFRERPLMADYGAFGISIQTEFPGTDGNGLFVLAVPQTGVTWGQETVFAFMELISQEQPAFDTLVCFLADSRPAVHGGDAYPYAGLRALLDDLDEREDAVIVYCDFSGAPSAITIRRGGGRASVPLALAEFFVETCAETETPYIFATDGYGAESIVAERSDGIPVLYLDDSAVEKFFQTKPALQPPLIPDKVAGTLYDFAAATLSHGTDTEADRNYAYIRIKGGIFVSEYTLVLLTLFVPVLWVLLCFLLYCASKSHHKRIFLPLLIAALLITVAPLAVLHSNGVRTEPSEPTSVRPPFSSHTETTRHFTASAEAVTFLGRRIVRIQIDARRTPLNYRLSFTEIGEKYGADIPISFLYDAPMPYTAEDKIIRFVLGDYPPMLLNLEITLPLNIDGYFTLDALFEDGTTATETFTVGEAASR